MADPKLNLRAGDILLYRPSSVFGWIIKVKTWHPVSHVEIYDGGLQSWASRDGVGVNRYDLRLSGLEYVLRPTVPLDLEAGRAWARSMVGTKYGWLDLAAFVGVSKDFGGIVCSPFAATLLRKDGWNVFPTDSANAVAPFQFLDLVGPECQIAYSPDDLAKIIDGPLKSFDTVSKVP